MSDATPMLLNMGAELGSSAGLKSFASQVPPIGGQTGAQGNEFAGVLQSVLAPDVAGPTDGNPIQAMELQADPLLLAKLGNAANPLLSQAMLEMDPAGLSIGNTLPGEEQDLAWQTLLAEYDSTDPDGTRVLLASGDAEGYQLEELSADDLFPQLQIQNSDELKQRVSQDENAELKNLLEDMEQNLSEQRDESMPDSPISLAAVQTQDIPVVAKPVVSSAEEEALSRLAKTEMFSSQQAGQRMQADAHTNALSAEQQADANQSFQDQIERMMGQGHSDFKETAATKADALINATSEQSFMVKPAAQAGASTYAAVSGFGTSQPSVASTSAPVIAQMTIPPQNPSWGEVVGDRLQWMANQNIQEAKIRLHPQELGQLDVHIQVGKDQQTTIAFSTPHAQVREALETAIPRLREMFGENGLTLGDVNVSQHSSSEQGQANRDDRSAETDRSPNAFSTGDTDTDSPDIPSTSRPGIQGNRMLDLYA